MAIVALVLTVFVAVIHVGFFVLESFLWTGPVGRRIFKMTSRDAEHTKVLAFNQGVYNLILAVGLFWAAYLGDAGGSIRYFFLGAVIVAGAVGGLTAKRSILVVQALPAAVALAVSAFEQ
jgi:putative membrane protein